MGKGYADDSAIVALDSVGIANTDDVRINPSTEDQQDAILSELKHGRADETLEAVLMELKIISLKLDCLQPRDELLDKSDLESDEQ